MVTIKKPYRSKVIRALNATNTFGLDFLATYINGDGYITMRSDKKGYVAYIKEQDQRKLRVLNEVIKSCLAVKPYNVPLSPKKLYRVQIPLSFHSAAALVVYGCDKALKSIPWYVNGRYFRFLEMVKDPEYITVKGGIAVRSTRLRQLMRAGYLTRVCKSPGNRPSIYRLSPKATILYRAVRLAMNSQPKALRALKLR